MIYAYKYVNYSTIFLKYDDLNSNIAYIQLTLENKLVQNNISMDTEE